MLFESHNFRPHLLLRGGNLQTLVAALLPADDLVAKTRQVFVTLSDGDKIVLHDNRPENWQETDPSVLLMHGLGGCHGSPYIKRAAQKLNDRGIRTFRMDLRGCGAGEQHAQGGAHCGSWDDVRQVVEALGTDMPSSPLHLVGYSMGGALALNMAGELGARPCGQLASVMAVCPPVDLHALDESFKHGAGRLYSRHLARMIWRQITRRVSLMENPPAVDMSRKPRHIREVDEQIIVPFHGYGTVDDYYDNASAIKRMADIRVPTLVVAAADDPVIPIAPLYQLAKNDFVKVQITPGGGHLGFVGRSGVDADRRWIDWRVVEWITNQQEAAPVTFAPALAS